MDRNTNTSRCISLLIILISFITGFSCTREDPEITTEELREHIEYLASGRLEGRYPGTAGDSAAAAYIAGEFRAAGLKLFGKRGYQPFSVVTDLAPGDSNFLYVEGREYEPGIDFSPFSVSSNQPFRGPVVFAGYGFRFSKKNHSWDDYQGMDVSDKWILLLRGNPEMDSTTSVFDEFSGERHKSMLAKDLGAKGIIFVSGKQFDPEDKLTGLAKRENPVGIPVLHVTRDVADHMLNPANTGIVALEQRINRTRKPFSFIPGTEIFATGEVNRTKTRTRNIIGTLKKGDPVTEKPWIMIGAHYDHLGWGGEGTSSRKPDTIAIHPGADDNASGVASMIEIAEKIASDPQADDLYLLCVAFGAEEMGLIGSGYFVDHPAVPLEQVNLMINLDMIGRLGPANKLQAGGTGTAREFEQTLKHSGAGSIELVKSREGYGPSDHASFYRKNIPVLFFSSGPHADYHTPADRTDKINHQGLKAISEYIAGILFRIPEMEDPFTFQEAGPKVRYEGRHGRRIALGIMPDFTSTPDTEGMRVDLVIEGKPAAGGGMKKGDLITAIDGDPVNDIYEYMYRLSKLEKGQSVVVTVKRKGEYIDLLIELQMP